MTRSCQKVGVQCSVCNWSGFVKFLPIWFAGKCLSISDAIGRRLRDGDKIRYKLKLMRKWISPVLWCGQTLHNAKQSQWNHHVLCYFYLLIQINFCLNLYAFWTVKFGYNFWFFFVLIVMLLMEQGEVKTKINICGHTHKTSSWNSTSWVWAF